VGEFRDGRAADDLPGRHGVDLAGAKGPFDVVDAERARAFLGEDLGPAVPLFPGGLITSGDGMLWLPGRA
jgi:hypothetical protein